MKQFYKDNIYKDNKTFLKRNYKKNMILGGLLGIAFCMAGCGEKQETKEYRLPDVYVSGEDLVKSNKGTKKCEEIFLNEDGSLTLVLTEKQRKDWADTKETETMMAMMSKMSGIKMKYSEDYKELEMTLPKDMDGAESPMISTFAWQAELAQILNGEEDWSLHVTVKNEETGEILQEVTLPEEELDWSFLEQN